MNKKSNDVFIVKSDSGIPRHLDLNSIKERIVFSSEFWQYFSFTFPDATVALFSQPSLSPNTVQLSDTTYVGITIHSLNRAAILNRLPKDLTEEQSKNYFKGGGYFVIPTDSLNQDSKHEYREEVTWKEASQQVQKEYMLFRSLLTDFDNDFIMIAKKDFIKNLLKDY